MPAHATRRNWHIGEWCIHPGQTYVESLSKSPKKGSALLNCAQPFVDALHVLNVMKWKHCPQFWKQVFIG
jgi:hypothetical protein